MTRGMIRCVLHRGSYTDHSFEASACVLKGSQSLNDSCMTQSILYRALIVVTSNNVRPIMGTPQYIGETLLAEYYRLRNWYARQCAGRRAAALEGNEFVRRLNDPRRRWRRQSQIYVRQRERGTAVRRDTRPHIIVRRTGAGDFGGT